MRPMAAFTVLADPAAFAPEALSTRTFAFYAFPLGDPAADVRALAAEADDGYRAAWAVLAEADPQSRARREALRELAAVRAIGARPGRERAWDPRLAAAVAAADALESLWRGAAPLAPA